MEVESLESYLQWIRENLANDFFRVIIFTEIGLSLGLFLMLFSVNIFFRHNNYVFWLTFIFASSLIANMSLLLPIHYKSVLVRDIYGIIIYTAAICGFNGLMAIAYNTQYNHYPAHKKWVWFPAAICVPVLVCMAFIDSTAVYFFLKYAFVLFILPSIIEGVKLYRNRLPHKKYNVLKVFVGMVICSLMILALLVGVNVHSNFKNILINVLFGFLTLNHYLWIAYFFSTINNQYLKSRLVTLGLEKEKVIFLKSQNVFLEQEIESRMAHLTKLNSTKDKIYSIIWHDIKSPINSFNNLAGVINYLIKAKKFEEISEVSNRLDEMGRELTALFENLQLWTDMQHSNSNLKMQKFSFSAFIENTMPIYRSIAMIQEVNLVEKMYSDDIDINSDPFILACIIRNLLDNALKNTSRHQTISVSTNIQSEYLLLTISNSITDIPTKKRIIIKNLFEGNQTYTSGESGMGLGLLMVYQFAKEINLAIEVQITSTQISFQLRLPKVSI